LSPDYEFHQSPGELLAGGFTDAFEKPERARLILDQLQSVNIGEIIQPD
jgi:hypothetical protein